jgi:hypothetical protein
MSPRHHDAAILKRQRGKKVFRAGLFIETCFRSLRDAGISEIYLDCMLCAIKLRTHVRKTEARCKDGCKWHVTGLAFFFHNANVNIPLAR